MSLTVAIINEMTGIIQAVGYPGIFFLMVLEGMLLPIPSEVVMVFGGYLLYENKLLGIGFLPGFGVLLLIGTIGNLVGALLAYYLGDKGGIPLIMKYGRYVMLDEKSINKTQEWFKRYGEISVFVTRLIPIFRTFISIPAGIAKMKLSYFIIFTVLGMAIWDTILIYIGIRLGPSWEVMLSYSDLFTYLALAAILALFLYWVYLTLKKKKDPMKIS
ncbi:DedA family protein [Oxyplasma meridianum]|uniref:DedA family protein n=1 Tax=Oxyplasma meridianum TaxID=3073602 RepID=A0AAX4NGG9_9ARCH